MFLSWNLLSIANDFLFIDDFPRSARNLRHLYTQQLSDKSRRLIRDVRCTSQDCRDIDIYFRNPVSGMRNSAFQFIYGLCPFQSPNEVERTIQSWSQSIIQTVLSEYLPVLLFETACDGLDLDQTQGRLSPIVWDHN